MFQNCVQYYPIAKQYEKIVFLKPCCGQQVKFHNRIAKRGWGMLLSDDLRIIAV